MENSKKPEKLVSTTDGKKAAKNNPTEPKIESEQTDASSIGTAKDNHKKSQIPGHTVSKENYSMI